LILGIGGKMIFQQATRLVEVATGIRLLHRLVDRITPEIGDPIIGGSADHGQQSDGQRDPFAAE
jgi:hypothetical protein